MALRETFPSTTTSNWLRSAGERNVTSTVVNAFKPSSRRISPRYMENGFDVEPTTSTGGGEASVVNDQLTSVSSGLPARSLAPLVPPLTVSVYVDPYASALNGVNVATFVDELYVTFVATDMLDASFSRKVDVVIVLAVIGSLKVAVAEVPTLTPPAPFAGVFAVTVGGMRSGWIRDAMSS